MADTTAEAGERRESAAAGAKRRPPSLSTRLIVVAAGWSVLALAVAGFILVSLYRTASESAFDERLDVYLTAILGAMSAGPPGEPARPGPLGEPRFDIPASGWYWTVSNAATGEVLFSSRSLLGDALVLPAPGGAGTERGLVNGPAGQELRFAERRVVFPGEETYRIAVAGETGALRDSIAAFAGQVALTLSVFGLGLVAAVVLQVRIGLRPLRRLQASLAAVRRGDAETVEEDLPRELAPLSGELNALIRSNREIVERARTHVGNLAHALKTPLSVVTNEARAASGPLAEKVAEQAAVMRTQIDHHLERARMAAQRRVIGVSTEIEPVVTRLVRAMTKIHRDRGIAIDMTLAADLRFRGERQDLEEMVGNLLDNACKWAKERVVVTVRPSGAPPHNLVEIEIGDDGPGLTPDEAAEAVKRGKRLDETVPGTGLGLSIVADLAAVYGGRLDFRRSSLGGLGVALLLPSV